MKKLHKKRLNGWVKWVDRRVIGSTHDCAVAKLYIIHVFACRATPDKLFVCMFLYIYIYSRGLNCLNVCFFVFRHDVYLSGYAWQALCVHVCVYVVGGWTVWMSVSLFTRMMCMFKSMPIDICVCLVGPDRAVVCVYVFVRLYSRATPDLFDSSRRTSICILYRSGASWRCISYLLGVHMSLVQMCNVAMQT